MNGRGWPWGHGEEGTCDTLHQWSDKVKDGSPKGRVQKKKKKWEFSHWGGGGLPISAPFPTFFYFFLNMVWIIQKCKEIFVHPLVTPFPNWQCCIAEILARDGPLFPASAKNQCQCDEEENAALILWFCHRSLCLQIIILLWCREYLM